MIRTRHNSKSRTEYERLYRIAGIVLRLKSDIGFSPGTFADKFQKFACSGKKYGVEILLIHKRKFPRIKGELLYEKVPWQIFFDGKFYYYNMIVRDKTSGILLGKIDKDCKRIEIFKNRRYTDTFQKGGLTSFTSFPSDQIIFSQILFQKGIVKNSLGIILHSCGVWNEERKQIVLFCGPSGAGKSTILKLLLKAGLRKEQILNDDRIIIRKKKDTFFAYGTPWHGELPYVSNLSGEISKIYILDKSKTDKVENIENKKAFEVLYKRTVRGLMTKGFQRNRIEFISKMINKVAMYKLEFSKENPHKLFRIVFS